MANPLRVVHYVNQFFGGVGGEEKANMPLEVRKGAIGPGRLFQQLLGEQGEVVATIICGDNYFSEQQELALAALKQALEESHPDILIAGPAFDAAGAHRCRIPTRRISGGWRCRKTTPWECPYWGARSDVPGVVG